MNAIENQVMKLSIGHDSRHGTVSYLTKWLEVCLLLNDEPEILPLILPTHSNKFLMASKAESLVHLKY